MAHRRRARLVDALLDRVGDVPVVWDRSHNRWDTGRRALLLRDPKADYHVVIQDDAIVCDRLLESVARVARHVPPECPIGLYYGKRMPNRNEYERHYRRAVRAGHRWIALRKSPLWGVAVAFPVAALDEIVAYADHVRSAAYDTRVRRWFTSQQRLEQWYPIPSLVDHRDDLVSVVSENKNTGRVAHEFIGERRSAFDLDWDTGVTR